MIKMNRIFLTVPIIIGFVACTNNKAGEKAATAELKAYVDSVNSATPVYTAENWAAIDQGYQARALKAEAGLAEMSDENKAELEASKKSYEELKAKYQTELEKNTIVDYRVALRNSLFGEGKVGADMTFSFANAANLLSIYQNFVDAVDLNRNAYSREDWDEIKVLYEALDTRKNVVEPDLSGPDNRAIAALKIKYASIYTTNRPTSKVRENSDAKK
jgi:hypothetical protein